MSSQALSNDERAALVAAILAHAALFAWLAWQKPAPPPPLPDRMTVTLADDLGMTSTSPEPLADPAPDSAPVLGETPPPPEPEPAPLPKPEPKVAAKPAVKPAPPVKPSATPNPPAKAAPKEQPKPAQKNPGGSRLDDAWRTAPSGASGKDPTKNAPAAAPSAQQQSSWVSAIGSKVRGPWNACAVRGLDAEQLRVTVRFSLDRFGEVKTMDEPVVTGITDGNRPQVARFKECAVRAIQTAAPFDNLPPQYYDYWKLRRLTFRKE